MRIFHGGDERGNGFVGIFLQLAQRPRARRAHFRRLVVFQHRRQAVAHVVELDRHAAFFEVVVVNLAPEMAERVGGAAADALFRIGAQRVQESGKDCRTFPRPDDFQGEYGHLTQSNLPFPRLGMTGGAAQGEQQCLPILLSLFAA
jgi:hypothetical protein